MSAKKKPLAAQKSKSKPTATRRSPSVDDLLGMVDLTDAATDTAAEARSTPDSARTPSPAARLTSAPSPIAISTAPARVAKIVGLDPRGRPLLKMPGDKAKPLAARSTLRVTEADVGREALVCFENGDASLPIITGLLDTPTPTSRASAAPERLTFEAGQELVLKVGKASITLTKDGRIVIRGADVLTRSSGSNRIKGGAVHIN